jgi:predicted neuraminidase
VRLSDDPTRSEQNPLLFPAPDGKLWLLWTAQISGRQDTAIVRRHISADQGRSWTEHTVPESTGLVHMNVLDLHNGSLVAFFRSRWADNIHVSRSTDGGRGWAAPVPTELPNNNSSIQAVRLENGQLAMVFNQSSAADATDRRLSLYDDLEADLAVPPGPRGRRRLLYDQQLEGGAEPRALLSVGA